MQSCGSRVRPKPDEPGYAEEISEPEQRRIHRPCLRDRRTDQEAMDQRMKPMTKPDWVTTQTPVQNPEVPHLSQASVGFSFLYQP